ncbi:hypothetical protein MP228_011461 [Amoeboaphelidium protococcarum]|nr:hypothetical protein MP228_011461 [Amoeboaphelidium protococcarum]
MLRVWLEVSFTGLNSLTGIKVDKFKIYYELKFDSLEKKVGSLEVDMKSNHKDSASLYQIRQSAQDAMSLGGPRYRQLGERLEELWFLLFGLAKGTQKELVSSNGDTNYGQLLQTSVKKMEKSSFCPSITGNVSLGLFKCIVSGHDNVDHSQVYDVIWMRSSLPTRQTQQHKETLVAAFQYLKHIRQKRGLESNSLLAVSLQSRYQSVEAVAEYFAVNFPSLKRVFMQRTGRLSISAPDNQAFLNILRQKSVEVFFDFEDKEVTHSDIHRYHPYEIIEIREAPQAEVDNAVKVLEAWRDQMLAKSREDEHFPYSADEFIKLGSIATYSILKDQSGKMSKILKQLKDQSLINKEYRDSIDQLTTRVGNLELFLYKVALMTMLEVYFMEKMFTEDSDIPEDFTLNNGLNSASEARSWQTPVFLKIFGSKCAQCF